MPLPQFAIGVNIGDIRVAKDSPTFTAWEMFKCYVTKITPAARTRPTTNCTTGCGTLSDAGELPPASLTIEMLYTEHEVAQSGNTIGDLYKECIYKAFKDYTPIALEYTKHANGFVAGEIAWGFTDPANTYVISASEPELNYEGSGCTRVTFTIQGPDLDCYPIA